MRIFCAEVKHFSLFIPLRHRNRFSFFYFQLTFRQIVQYLMSCNRCRSNFCFCSSEFELYLLIAWKFIFSNNLFTIDEHCQRFYFLDFQVEYYFFLLLWKRTRILFKYESMTNVHFNDEIIDWQVCYICKSMNWKYFPNGRFVIDHVSYLFLSFQSRLSCEREISLSFSINQFLL